MIRICKSLEQLSANSLYDALQWRSEVFVVEQTCIYLDPDGKDKSAMHLLYYQTPETQTPETQTPETQAPETVAAENPLLLAYARLLPAGISYPTVSFGRVAVHESARDKGIGRKIVQDCIDTCHQLWPEQAISIGAQCYLKKFYTSFGFTEVSEEYLEDGIMHVDMRLDKHITSK